tara:strand:- start:5814 stop:6827 length:1014 start_codon:yes stop_codon:yes gene_type:complete
VWFVLFVVVLFLIRKLNVMKMSKVLSVAIVVCLIIGFSSCKKKGCMDPYAINYNEKAKKDDPDSPCLYASEDPENKNVVLQEFTAINCGACPGGHKVGDEIQAANPNDVVIMAIHGGTGLATPNGPDEVDLRTEWRNDLLSGWGTGGSFGYPMAFVNRRDFSSSGLSAWGGYGMYKSNWSAATDIVLAEPSYVNVAASSTINTETRELTVHAEAFFTADGALMNKLHIALLQNNILSAQSGSSSYSDLIDPATGLYKQQHILRHMITGSDGESLIETSSGTRFVKDFTYVIPADIDYDPNDNYPGAAYDLNNLEVVVYISDAGTTEIISGAYSSWRD